jgi:hypothetical protein
VFLVNSRFPLVSATPRRHAAHSCSQQEVPLLPKLRGHFAEFLDHSSPERLGILYQTTCVGLGYGPARPSLEAFLDSIGTPRFTPTGSPSDLRHPRGGFAYRAPYVLGPGQPPPGTGYLPASPHHSPPPAQAAGRPHRTRRHDGLDGLSITGLGPCGPRRVREYQPVNHRLRLSASP